MAISASTKLVGLLGHQISHSLSPLIHNTTAQWLGIDACYLALDSKDRRFPNADFFRQMWDFGAVGFNVTTPFKEDAARLFGGGASINTIYRGDDAWKT